MSVAAALIHRTSCRATNPRYGWVMVLIGSPPVSTRLLSGHMMKLLDGSISVIFADGSQRRR